MADNVIKVGKKDGSAGTQIGFRANPRSKMRIELPPGAGERDIACIAATAVHAFYCDPAFYREWQQDERPLTRLQVLEQIIDGIRRIQVRDDHVATVLREFGQAASIEDMAAMLTGSYSGEDLRRLWTALPFARAASDEYKSAIGIKEIGLDNRFGRRKLLELLEGPYAVVEFRWLDADAKAA